MLLDDYKKFLSNGYYDEDGIEKSQLFLEYPIRLAKEFKNDKKTISYGQMRNIFNKLNVLSLKLKSKQMSFKEIYNELNILYSKINDKYNKGSINKSFLDFFKTNIDVVKEDKDIYCFTRHFQCVCNFYPKDNKQELNNNNDYSKKSSQKNNFYNNYGGRK